VGLKWNDSMQRYPVILEPDDNDTLLLTIPDFPEVVTYGDDETSALSNAIGALTAAISARMDSAEDLPKPTQPSRGQRTVTMPALIAIKSAIYSEMRSQGVNKSELARRLEQNPRQVDRLLDVLHQSRHDQLDRAMNALGKRILVNVEDAA